MKLMKKITKYRNINVLRLFRNTDLLKPLNQLEYSSRIDEFMINVSNPIVIQI